MIQITLPRSTDWRLVFTTSLLLVLSIQGIIHLNPYNLSWITDGSFSWSNLIQFILIDQVLIEVITVICIVFALNRYVSYRKLYQTRTEFKNLFKYLIQFIPLFLIVYTVFAPITTTIRFLYHYFPHYDWETYRQSYFFINSSIYLSYLLPVFLTGYSLVLRGIVIGILCKEDMQDRSSEHTTIASMSGPIALNTVSMIYRQDRKYWIKSQDGPEYQTRDNLSEIVKRLPNNFVRINRKVILPICEVISINHWENQKYILHSKQGQEFVISRARKKYITDLTNCNKKHRCH